MGSLTDVWEKKVLDLIFRNTGASATTPMGLDATNIYVCLFTVMPTDSTVGTEVAGGSYTRVGMNRTGTGWTAAVGSVAETHNAANITFPTATANWGTIVGWGLCASFAGALSTDLVFWSNVFATTQVFTGDVVQIPATNISIQVDPESAIWQTGLETGTFDDFTFNGGGGIFDNGIFSTTVDTGVKRTGVYSLKQTITPPGGGGDSGCRAFRWLEPRLTRDLYYSSYLYIPNSVQVTGNFWNIFQWKTRTTDGSRIDPSWAIYLGNNGSGGVYCRLGWGFGGYNSSSGAAVPGPLATDGVYGGKFIEPIGGAGPATIPFATWTHLVGRIRCCSNGGYDGIVQFWLNGVLLFDQQNVNTSFNNSNYNSWHGDEEFAVCNYSDGLSTGTQTLYWDDLSINTSFVP